MPINIEINVINTQDRLFFTHMLSVYIFAAQRLRNLKITVSMTLDTIDEESNVCSTYAGPPGQGENPIDLPCGRYIPGRYLKIYKNTTEDQKALTLCEVHARMVL